MLRDYDTIKKKEIAKSCWQEMNLENVEQEQ